ncbi:MAG TPA: T9SS type A sorting domain-containing protein, partial [Bacteroidales bacterium]|nr:T9SS type A sorting domain-containing protein [Bacteroidales bacterium]
KTVTISAPTAQTITGTTPICIGSNQTWTSTTGGGTWTSGTPAVATVGSGTGIVTGVTAGSSVITYTVTTGVCVNTATKTVTVNNNTIVPTFTALGPYCVDATPGILPATSNNGITGTWSPDMINTASTGTTTYTFTPTTGQCAVQTTMNIEVDENITPLFTQLGPYCVGATPGTLPTTSNNGISGTWDPATISTASAGTTTYTFTPTIGQCATNTVDMIVTVNANVLPTFAVLGPYCVGAIPDALPTTSTNGITGTWSPAVISTSAAGTTLYTFTPTAGQCATTATMNVTVNQMPFADAGVDATYTVTPIQIGNAANGPGTISWSPSTGLSNPNIAQPLASPAVTTTYTLTVVNNGCIATDAVTITIGDLGHTISGKTLYSARANVGIPAPNPATYNAVAYSIDNVIVILKNYPSGTEVARDTSDALGHYQFNAVMNGNYILSYVKYAADTMQWCNDVNAGDVGLLMYLITSDTVLDPSRCFSAKYQKAADVDNNNLVNTIDVARIKAKIGSPYLASKNFPKGNWDVLNSVVTMAGADLNINLQTICNGDYNASSSKYRDSLTTWSGAKSHETNIIVASNEYISITDPGYFEIPLRISSKMNEFSALGLELTYPEGYKLTNAYIPKALTKTGAVKINPTLDEIITDNNDLLVTDEGGVIRVVYATTKHFDVAANDEMIVLGFRKLNDKQQLEPEFKLSGTGIIANQYGEEDDGAYLLMPKLLVQGGYSGEGFEFTGYPNPFNGEATITYNLPENGTVKIKAYNATGELVSEIINEEQIAGKHMVDFSPKYLPAGMYTFKLEFVGLNRSECLILKMIH